MSKQENRVPKTAKTQKTPGRKVENRWQKARVDICAQKMKSEKSVANKGLNECFYFFSLSKVIKQKRYFV